LRSPFRRAPAAFWCARTLVPSRNTMPSAIPRSCTRVSQRSQTPALAQRMKIWAALHQGPSSSGTDRHLAPFWCRQRMAETVRRRSCGGVLPFGRHASIRGSRRAHCPSLSLAPPHRGGAKRNSIQSVQATTRPSRHPECQLRVQPVWKRVDLLS
jgi:hypothetical protein